MCNKPVPPYRDGRRPDVFMGGTSTMKTAQAINQAQTGFVEIKGNITQETLDEFREKFQKETGKIVPILDIHSQILELAKVLKDLFPEELTPSESVIETAIRLICRLCIVQKAP